MYWRSRNTPAGVAAPGIMTPQMEPDSPVAEIALKTPTSVIVGGTINVARITRKNVICPRNRYFDNENAAMELISRVRKVAITVTSSELVKQEAKLTLTP